MKSVNEGKKKQHILVVSQYFYPENFRINDICEAWVKRGHEVTVLTGIPNYPQGKFFKGYGFFRKRKEKYKGINIIRVPILARGKSSIGLVLNYLSYVISGFFWTMFTRVKADKVFIFEVSPMTQALVGVWYANRRKIPCAIYVQDLWPENIEAVTGMHNPKVLGIIDKMVNYIYANCGLILATSPSFVKRLEERESVYDEKGKSKVEYWPQYAEEFYQPSKPSDLNDLKISERFRIVFTGNIGYAQGLDILPKVACLLKEKRIDCEFVIIGDGRYADEFVQDITDKNVKEMFTMLGRKRPEEIPSYLALCDWAFVSFANNELFEMTIPAKIQSYMACGMPILAVARGETQRIIEEAKCGICVENKSAESLSEKLIQFWDEDNVKIKLEEWKIHALNYKNEKFSATKLLDKICEIFIEK